MWIFGIPNSTDCICSSTVVLYIISMKELTLIHVYQQTLERPKPPVKQHMKVMDILKKKMQTILEREDLSADERLELYDQSFTRFENVYVDYRPGPVGISSPTPESESPDPIESEISDSVPKTMKAKAQPLLKKMKINRDITWNEKGELEPFKEATWWI